MRLLSSLGPVSLVSLLACGGPDEAVPSSTGGGGKTAAAGQAGASGGGPVGAAGSSGSSGHAGAAGKAGPGGAAGQSGASGQGGVGPGEGGGAGVSGTSGQGGAGPGGSGEASGAGPGGGGGESGGGQTGGAGGGEVGGSDGSAGGPASPTLAPFDCAGASSPVVFVSEQLPPAPLAVQASVAVNVTFANCGPTTWHGADAGAATGIKLGSQAPQDSLTWGSNRRGIGVDVAPGTAVTIPFVLQVPAAAGSYGYQWKLVDEGVAWLEPPSPLHTLVVEAPAVTLCPGVTVDVTGGQPASAAIQQCLDQLPDGGTLELPVGTYRMTAKIALDRPVTLRTKGLDASAPGCLSGATCAVLRADDNLSTDRGFVRIGTTDHVVIEHIVIDGNRAARLGSAAAAACKAGTNGAGFNAGSSGCTGCMMTGSASIRALCGTGMEWLGANAVFTGNTFADNGSHQDTNLWADGLTALQADGAKISDNVFRDNSDVDLILGSGRFATVTANTVMHAAQASFAGLMLDNFNGGTSGDFTGAVVSGNSVDCGAQLCDFAVELGPHAWYPSANTIGGTVSGNTIAGGKFNINAQGAGTAAAPVVVFGNTLGPAPTSGTFLCGVRPCTSFAVSPDSFVDTSKGPPPTGTLTHSACP